MCLYLYMWLPFGHRCSPVKNKFKSARSDKRNITLPFSLSTSITLSCNGYVMSTVY